MNLEESIRQIVAEEITKRSQAANLTPLSQFCKDKKISRVTVWRAEKKGTLKIIRIGKRKFIDNTQFV